MKTKTLLALTCACGFLAAFALFSICVKKNFFHLHALDFDVDVKIQDHIPKKFDPAFSVLTLAGGVEVMSALLLGLLIVRGAWKNRKLLWMVPLYVFGLLVEVFGKNLVLHPGPPYYFYRYNVGPGFASNYLHTSYSYPSGHSFRTIFVLSMWLFYIWQQRKLKLTAKIMISLPLVFLAGMLLVGLVILGEHWLSDVIGGVLLAGGCALLAGELGGML